MYSKLKDEIVNVFFSNGSALKDWILIFNMDYHIARDNHIGNGVCIGYWHIREINMYEVYVFSNDFVVTTKYKNYNDMLKGMLGSLILYSYCKQRTNG